MWRLVEAWLRRNHAHGAGAERDVLHHRARRVRSERGAHESGRRRGIRERRSGGAASGMRSSIGQPTGPLEGIRAKTVTAQSLAEHLGEAGREIDERIERLDAPGTLRGLLENGR